MSVGLHHLSCHGAACRPLLIPGIPGLPDAMKVTNPDIIIIVVSALRHWV
jgi:hypothetical protein